MTTFDDTTNIKCPHCGASYYMELYSMTTALGCPTVIKDGKVISKNPNTVTRTCKCLNCGKTFTVSSK